MISKKMEFFSTAVRVFTVALVVLSSGIACGETEELAVLKKIEEHFNHRDIDASSAYLDAQEILESTKAKITGSKNYWQNFALGAKTTLESGQLFEQIFSQLVGTDKPVKLVHYYRDNSAVRSIYRFDYGDNGYSYMEFIIEGTGKDRRIVDWYDNATGQQYTDQLARIYDSVAPSDGIVGRLADLTSDKDKIRYIIVEFYQRNQARDLEGIKSLYDNYHGYILQSWDLTVIFYGSASTYNDQEFYFKILSDIAKHFNSDRRAKFILLDYYFSKGSIRRAVDIMEELFERFGRNDAAMKFLQSTAHYTSGDYQKSADSAKLCIDLEPEFERCYWTLVSIATETKQYSKTVDYLNMLSDRFGHKFEKATFEAQPYYLEFANSQEFERWEIE